MASLLRKSNMTAILPEGAFWLPPAEIKAFLAYMWYRMGWLGGQSGEGERFLTVALCGSSRDEEEDAKGRELTAIGGGDSSKDNPALRPSAREDETPEDGGGSSAREDESAYGLPRGDETPDDSEGSSGGDDEPTPSSHPIEYEAPGDGGAARVARMNLRLGLDNRAARIAWITESIGPDSSSCTSQIRKKESVLKYLSSPSSFHAPIKLPAHPHTRTPIYPYSAQSDFTTAKATQSLL